MAFVWKQFTRTSPSLLRQSFLSTASRCHSTERPVNPGDGFVGKDFLTLRDFSATDIRHLLWVAQDLKTRIKIQKERITPLSGKSAALIFQKRSTRTRTSSETGFALLGGHPAFLSASDVHLGVSETIHDTAKVLSGLVDLILLRCDKHEEVEELAKHASVPVVNGLSETFHPLQTLADILTMKEHFASRYASLDGLNVAWVGDGNNIIHSLLMGCLPLGINMRVATPKGYELFPNVAAYADLLANKHSTEFLVTNDPLEAVRGANVIVTDTWISMGQEEEKAARLKAFEGYQVTSKMCEEAASDWVFLHCLPRKQEEVADEVFFSPRSLVYQEAENRKWTVMAVMLSLLGQHTPTTEQPRF
eukprot:scpid76064/ scgid6741/ Ornithine carbamoyltransferase, mitochondrial; Ornithine transcarbamylase